MSRTEVRAKPKSSAEASGALPLLRSAAAKSAFYVPWASLCAAPLCDLLLGTRANRVGVWLLLLSALLFGLPHGASDLQVLKRTQAKRTSFVWAVLAYLGLALVVLALWAFSPSVALILFLAVSAWHFGEGDAIWSREEERSWPLEAIGRGLLIVMAPVCFHPTEAGSILSVLLSGDDTARAERTITTLQFLAGPLLLVALGLVAASSIASRRAKSPAVGRTPLVVPSNSLALRWIEIALLLFAFWATTPLLALAFYFIGVHSWRHILRLQIRSGEFVGAWRTAWRFHRRWFAATALTLAIFLPLFWLGSGVWILAQPVAAYLMLLSALAVPHAALIAWAERALWANGEGDEGAPGDLLAEEKEQNAQSTRAAGARGAFETTGDLRPRTLVAVQAGSFRSSSLGGHEDATPNLDDD